MSTTIPLPSSKRERTWTSFLIFTPLSPEPPNPKKKPPDVHSRCLLLEKVLGLIDFGGQIRTAASIRVVQEHQLAMILADAITREVSIAVFWY